jgi:hypothetical protein
MIRHPLVVKARERNSRSYDAGKRVKGRKRHIAADTSCLLLGIVVHAADTQTRTAHGIC